MKRDMSVKQTAPFVFRTVFRDTSEGTTAKDSAFIRTPDMTLPGTALTGAVPGIVHDTTNFRFRMPATDPERRKGREPCRGRRRGGRRRPRARRRVAPPGSRRRPARRRRAAPPRRATGRRGRRAAPPPAARRGYAARPPGGRPPGPPSRFPSGPLPTAFPAPRRGPCLTRRSPGGQKGAAPGRGSPGPRGAPTTPSACRPVPRRPSDASDVHAPDDRPPAPRKRASWLPRRRRATGTGRWQSAG